MVTMSILFQVKVTVHQATYLQWVRKLNLAQSLEWETVVRSLKDSQRVGR